jgi:RNA polymerase primary sigma factor
MKKKNKKTIKKKIVKQKKSAPKKAKVKKTKTKSLTKKIVKKEKRGESKKLSSAEKKIEHLNQIANDLIDKGRKRGFITYDEILKTFPDVENNIVFLDDLYEKLSVSGIDVLEGGNLLNLDTDISASDLLKSSMHDSIQMYPGQYIPVIYLLGYFQDHALGLKNRINMNHYASFVRH